MAPCREEQRQIPPAVPAARERQGGPGEGYHGERGSVGERAQRGGEEVRGEIHRDLGLNSYKKRCILEAVIGDGCYSLLQGSNEYVSLCKCLYVFVRLLVSERLFEENQM